VKLTRFSLTLAILMAGIASPASSYAASSYKVTLPSDLFAGETQLKAGEYTLTVEAKQVVLKKGKESFSIPAVVEKNTSKFQETVLELTGTKIQAIDIGGTDLRIILRSAH
jgi:hypothetical protein